MKRRWWKARGDPCDLTSKWRYASTSHHEQHLAPIPSQKLLTPGSRWHVWIRNNLVTFTATERNIFMLWQLNVSSCHVPRITPQDGWENIWMRCGQAPDIPLQKPDCLLIENTLPVHQGWEPMVSLIKINGEKNWILRSTIWGSWNVNGSKYEISK